MKRKYDVWLGGLGLSYEILLITGIWSDYKLIIEGTICYIVIII